METFFSVEVGVAERDKGEVDNGVQISLVKGFEHLVDASLYVLEKRTVKTKEFLSPWTSHARNVHAYFICITRQTQRHTQRHTQRQITHLTFRSRRITVELQVDLLYSK